MSFSDRGKCSFKSGWAGLLLGLAMVASFTFSTEVAVAAGPDESVPRHLSQLQMIRGCFDLCHSREGQYQGNLAAVAQVCKEDGMDVCLIRERGGWPK